MKQRLLNIIILLTVAVLPAGLYTGFATAACTDSGSTGQVLQGINQDAAQCNTGSEGVPHVVATVVNILSIVVGIAAVIMVIVSGFRYITSGGASERVGTAKNTLIYALIGVAIAALAQLLVHFVLFQSSQAALPRCPADHSIKPPKCAD